jgi:hypothetical protein
MDMNPANQIANGNEAALRTVRKIQSEGHSLTIAESAYREFVDRAPSEAIARERAGLLKDLGIERGDTRNMSGRVKALLDNEDKAWGFPERSHSNRQAPGEFHHGDAYVVAQAKALGAEIWTLDDRFRTRVRRIRALRRRYGQARLAPESFEVPVTPTPPGGNTGEILRRLRGARAAVRSLLPQTPGGLSDPTRGATPQAPRIRPAIPPGRLRRLLVRVRGFAAGIAGTALPMMADWAHEMFNEESIRRQSKKLDEELGRIIDADHPLLRIRAVLMLLEGKKPYALVVRKVFQVAAFDDTLHRWMWEVPVVSEWRFFTGHRIPPSETVDHHRGLLTQSKTTWEVATFPLRLSPKVLEAYVAYEPLLRWYVHEIGHPPEGRTARQGLFLISRFIDALYRIATTPE